MNTIARTITLLSVLVTVGGATTQETDTLIVRGKLIRTYDTPSLKEAFPALKIPEFRVMSTANYKGYSATWAVFRGQLYLVGLEALADKGNKMIWYEQILKNQKFPVKVEAWSGVVKQSTYASSTDFETGKREVFDLVSTIVFVKGKVTKVEFDKKVLRKEKSKE